MEVWTSGTATARLQPALPKSLRACKRVITASISPIILPSRIESTHSRFDIGFPPFRKTII